MTFRKLSQSFLETLGELASITEVANVFLVVSALVRVWAEDKKLEERQLMSLAVSAIAGQVLDSQIVGDFTTTGDYFRFSGSGLKLRVSYLNRKKAFKFELTVLEPLFDEIELHSITQRAEVFGWMRKEKKKRSRQNGPTLPGVRGNGSDLHA